MTHHYKAVLFDLLSALLDSWTLWDELAGDSTLGREWRMRYLEATCQSESYRPYLSLVGETAAAVGVAEDKADDLARRWSELRPWPEASAIVAELASTMKIGVVTNCSEGLGVEAANILDANFDTVVTAERAGYYKPDPRVYQKAIEEIGEASERILYVAGSPYDVLGAAAVGMPVFWHNRIGIVNDDADSMAIESSDTLDRLRDLVV